MGKMKIDLEDLTVAMEDNFEGIAWYLDKETGKVVLVSEGKIEEEEELAQQIEQNPDRYVFVERVESHEGFRIMEDFIDSLPESKAQDDLADAIRRRKPFRSFKDALSFYPDIREQWFAFHEEALAQMAREWLGSTRSS